MANSDMTSSQRAYKEEQELNRKLTDKFAFYAGVRSYSKLLKKSSSKLERYVKICVYEVLSGQLEEESAKYVTDWLMNEYYKLIMDSNALDELCTADIPTLGRVHVRLSRPSKYFYLEDPISRLYIFNQVGDTLCEVPMYLIHAIYSINALDSAFM